MLNKLCKSRTALIRPVRAFSSRRMMRCNVSHRTRDWPFAALDPAAAAEQGQKPKLFGIVFDADGEPQNYMFGEMRDALGIPKSVDILDHIESIPRAEQEGAHEKIRAIERRAMRVQTPQPGVRDLMEYLEARGVRKAICTRNFDEPVAHLLTKFLPTHQFAPIITRSFKPPKPDPAGIVHIAQEWGNDSSTRATNMIMVGDSLDDMLAGSKAGAVTILLAQDEVNLHVRDHELTDYYVTRLDEIIPVLERGVLLPVGDIIQ